MKRYLQLAKETWWLWTLFIIGCVLLVSFVSFVFLIMLPICICVFVYFAIVRYDDDGNYIGG